MITIDREEQVTTFAQLIIGDWFWHCQNLYCKVTGHRAVRFTANSNAVLTDEIGEINAVCKIRPPQITIKIV